MGELVYGSRSDPVVVDETDMRAWAASHGSTRLQTALARGYPCTRTYLEERAARDFVGWSMLTEDADLGIAEATDPSDKALALEGQALAVAEALCMPPGSVRVVSVREEHWSPEHGECFRLYEAVLISGYLGEFRLLRAV
jgi:hypothetical protein